MDFNHIAKYISEVDSIENVSDQKLSDNYPLFLNSIKIDRFRSIENLEVKFENPITVISGANRSGKTSLLILIAGSHETFLRASASKPKTSITEHHFGNLLSYTDSERETEQYSYWLEWREGERTTSRQGMRKPNTSGSRWGGVGKKRTGKGGKIKNRHLRFVDLERLTPARNFSISLFRKSKDHRRMSHDLETAFCYIFEVASAEIYILGSHVNKYCYLIKEGEAEYSTYNAAIGEESVINILREILYDPEDPISSPVKSLILIDEVEAGLHPKIQRRLAEVIKFISWKQKKQFILTTHSPTLISSFTPSSRKFIDVNPATNKKKVINKISERAVRSKMDAKAYPLVRVFCEDDTAKRIIVRQCQIISEDHPYFEDLIEIIISGNDDKASSDFRRQNELRSQFVEKIGMGLILDGDCRQNENFKDLHKKFPKQVGLLPMQSTPEIEMANSYLKTYPHEGLKAFIKSSENKHLICEKMIEFGRANDKSEAKSRLIDAFFDDADQKIALNDFRQFLIALVTTYSN